MSLTNAEPCPCGRTRVTSGKPAKAVALPYADCCGSYLDHGDDAVAPDAESLMRSRYTAFVRERGDYLQATWHPSTRPAALDFQPGTQWLGLEVRMHHDTGADTAEVEFVARHRTGGRAVRLHERSQFERLAQGWVYVHGEIL